jgi:hypothetical protein
LIDVRISIVETSSDAGAPHLEGEPTHWSLRKAEFENLSRKDFIYERQCPIDRDTTFRLRY